MLPLSLDDLLPLEEYAAKRGEYFESHRRYVDRYRLVRVGPEAKLLFENRQTLWFRVQEMLRIARLGNPQLVQRELDLLNRLLPHPGLLQAGLVIDVRDQRRLTAELATWSPLAGKHIRFFLGKAPVESRVVTSRPEDRALGAAQWIQFALDGEHRKQLADIRQPAWIEIALPAYKHQSPLLSDEIRQSLVDDLGQPNTMAAA